LKIFVRVNIGQGGDRIAKRGGARDQLPGTLVLDDAFDKARLTSSGKQSSIVVTELAFTVIVGARQVGNIVAVEQSWGIVDGGLADLLAESG